MPHILQNSGEKEKKPVLPFMKIEPSFRKHWEEEAYRWLQIKADRLMGKETIVLESGSKPFQIYTKREIVDTSEQLYRSYCYFRELERTFGVGYGFIDNVTNQFVLTRLISTLLALSQNTDAVISLLESESSPIVSLLSRHNISITGKYNYLVSESSGTVCQTFARTGLYLYTRLPYEPKDGQIKY